MTVAAEFSVGGPVGVVAGAGNGGGGGVGGCWRYCDGNGVASVAASVVDGALVVVVAAAEVTVVAESEPRVADKYAFVGRQGSCAGYYEQMFRLDVVNPS